MNKKIFTHECQPQACEKRLAFPPLLIPTPPPQNKQQRQTNSVHFNMREESEEGIKENKSFL
jgi:hypothetical protein